MNASVPFKLSFSSGDDEKPEFSGLSNPKPSSPEPSNPYPSFAASQTAKYSVNDFQQIFKTILEV